MNCRCSFWSLFRAIAIDGGWEHVRWPVCQNDGFCNGKSVTVVITAVSYFALVPVTTNSKDGKWTSETMPTYQFKFHLCNCTCFIVYTFSRIIHIYIYILFFRSNFVYIFFSVKYDFSLWSRALYRWLEKWKWSSEFKFKTWISISIFVHVRYHGSTILFQHFISCPAAMLSAP